jgi:hypothetical protein
MTSPRPLRVVAVSFAVTALLASAACGGGGKAKKTATPSAPSTSPSSTVSSPPPPAPKNPFTGIGPVPTTPVISVKIDDTAPGRPQVGINQADIVYIEAVEGGLTRLAAIFGTNKPAKVGYVRSTRPSDPDLLLQFGKITAAYSGGAHDSLPLIRKSGIKSWSNDAGAAYFFRSPHPGDHGYINLALNLAKVAKSTKTNAPRSIGWTFQATDPGLPATKGTDIRTSVRGSYQAGTAVEFRYNPTLKKYVRYIGGQRQVDAAGHSVTATNVVVQFCRVVAHTQDTDVNGNPSQFTYTVGSGKVAVFRQGKRIDGTWSRLKLDAGTTFKAANGATIPLVPGNTWVVLATNGTPLQG